MKLPPFAFPVKPDRLPPASMQSPFSKGGEKTTLPFIKESEEAAATALSTKGEEVSLVANNEVNGSVTVNSSDPNEKTETPPFEKGGAGGISNKNLCRDVCAERVRRVIQGYTNKKGETVTGMGGGFAYFRTYRHATEILFNSIQHEAIWTALQLIHTETVSPFEPNALIQRLGHDNTTVLYLPKINGSVLKDMQGWITKGSILVIYSWQPGLLRQHFEDDRMSFLPIPQFLVDRFGGR